MEIDIFGNVIVRPPTPENLIKEINLSPFDYINSISTKTRPDTLKDYSPWIANVSFSGIMNTVHLANEMNKYHNLDPALQFDFYYYALPRGKYYSNWVKSMKSEYTEAIQEYFNVSYKIAKQYETILTKDHLEKIQEWHDTRKGGKAKKK